MRILHHRSRAHRIKGMLPFRIRPLLFLVILVMGVAIGACGGSVALRSESMTEPPAIDGALDDWGQKLHYVDDDPLSVGVVPTDSLLYVALAIRDEPLVRSVATNGLIVWVDPSATEKRTYGIRYPLGLAQQHSSPERSEEATPGRGGNQSLSEALSLSELEVVRGESRRRVPAEFSSGLRGSIVIDPGSMVYELAIPVGGDSAPDAERHGLGASLDGTIGIGLQIPEDEEGFDGFEEGDEISSVSGRPGRGRTPTGRRAGRRRRPPSTMGTEGSDPPSLDLWIRVEPGPQE